MAHVIRHIYDDRQDEVSEMSGISFLGDPGLTKQSAKDECDINKITARYERTGALPDMIRANPKYGDFSEAPTYLEACNIVLHAEEQFMALDAKVRARFANDPALFLEFATNKENLEEMVKMGLAIAPSPAPAPVPEPKSN